MKVLHILKEKPSKSVEKIIDLQANENEALTVRLYDGEVDYDNLLQLIFSCDRVISW